MFVDAAQIRVQAGSGGAGCLSFRREKHTPRGGPDGGDGGDGGSVYLIADPHLNTLVDFQYDRLYQAPGGKPGAGRNITGRSGADLHLEVPLGTRVHDADTDELIDELTQPGQRVLVAAGGAHGIGNAHFKSSINRSPRRTIPGQAGELRALRLELRLLADVGLVGLPNAGKSSLIRKLTNATPKIASYPFTTLKPSLGVVSMNRGRSYTIADVPGLIEGASDGSGLGIRFLNHLRHTRLLFHLVDLADSGSLDELVRSVAVITHELSEFDAKLGAQTRWLVFNKSDLLPPPEAIHRVRAIVKRFDWDQPYFMISAATGEGCKRLAGNAMTWLEENPVSAEEDASLESIEL